MNIYQELYNEDAKNLKSTVSLSGRLSFQRYALKGIVPDVVRKLELKPTDTLLDIGCNCGEVTIPLSFLCDSVTGVDGKEVVERLKERAPGINNIETITGDFMGVNIDKKFDCILIYSVLVYMDSYEEKARFIKKAAELLKPGGRLLVGDIINSSVQKRFGESQLGEKVNAEYRDNLDNNLMDEDTNKKQKTGPALQNVLTDETLMKLLLNIRKWGYESFLLPQSFDLAFGYTRQDILVKKW